MQKDEFNEKYDIEFINLMMEIEKRLVNLLKNDRLFLDKWVIGISFI